MAGIGERELKEQESDPDVKGQQLHAGSRQRRKDREEEEEERADRTGRKERHTHTGKSSAT